LGTGREERGGGGMQWSPAEPHHGWERRSLITRRRRRYPSEFRERNKKKEKELSRNGSKDG